MAIITISRQFGSLGTIIAKALKDELKLEYLDKIKLEETLVSDYGIPEEKVERYDEKKPAFWDISARLLGRLCCIDSWTGQWSVRRLRFSSPITPLTICFVSETQPTIFSKTTP